MSLGILLIFLLIRIGGNDPLCTFRFVADDETHVGQGHTALCPRVDAEAGAADLVGLG